MKKKYAIAAIALAWSLGGCAEHIDPALVKAHQMQVQNMQTRIFATQDNKRLIRGILSTFQELGFILDKVNPELDTVTATKFGDYPIQMTVTVRPLSEMRLLVHGDAQYDATTIEEPKLYQQFFSTLQQALLLTAQPAE